MLKEWSKVNDRNKMTIKQDSQEMFLVNSDSVCFNADQIAGVCLIDRLIKPAVLSTLLKKHLGESS